MKTLKPFKLSGGALSAAAMGLCAALLGGCNDSNDGPAISTPNASWTGKSIDSIQFASPKLLFYNGQLLVGSQLKAQPGTAVIDTGTNTISAYYNELLPPTCMAVTPDSEIVITESNYQQGAVSVLNLSTKELQKSVISFDEDNYVDTAGGRVYLFDLTSGAITGFTGHEPNENIAFNAQTGGSASDPYDIAVANNLAFIPRYDMKSLLILDPTQLNGGTRDSIDLSAYVSRTPVDSVAATPNMSWVTAYNGYVFVALQRLNYSLLKALDTSLVVVINASTKQVVSTIPLHFKDPISAHAVGSTWYLTSVGNYDQTGGVEKIDLSQQIKTSTAIISADSMFVDLFDFVPTGTHSGYVDYSADGGYTYQVKKVSY